MPERCVLSNKLYSPRITRDKVFEELERILDVSFRKIGPSRKFRVGTDGRKICVVGGYQAWHAIPEEVFKQNKQEIENRMIVFARREQQFIELYKIQALSMFLEIDKLTHKNKVYYFHIKEIRDDKITIKQMEGLSMKKFYEFPYYGLSVE